MKISFIASILTIAAMISPTTAEVQQLRGTKTTSEGDAHEERKLGGVYWAETRAHDKGCQGNFHVWHVRCEWSDASWGWSHDCSKPNFSTFKGREIYSQKKLPDPAWAEIRTFCLKVCETVDPLEDELLSLVNGIRASGTYCNGKWYGPQNPLQMDPSLRCAARYHSQWMLDNVKDGGSSHESKGGALGNDRKERGKNAGFLGRVNGENVSKKTNRSARAAFDGWLTSIKGHCETMMKSRRTHVGIGVARGPDRNLWTLMTGRYPA